MLWVKVHVPAAQQTLIPLRQALLNVLPAVALLAILDLLAKDQPPIVEMASNSTLKLIFAIVLLVIVLLQSVFAPFVQSIPTLAGALLRLSLLRARRVLRIPSLPLALNLAAFALLVKLRT